MNYFPKVKGYLLDLNYEIVRENESDSLFIINAPEKGIVNMLIDCEGEVLVLEQHMFDAKNADLFQRLLQMNRHIVHGAFALDETGKRVIFRDTLQLSNLDLNELEASINSLSLALAEHGHEFLAHAKA